MEDIILVGAGGHAKSVIEVIESTESYKIKGIIDMSENVGKMMSGYPIIGTDKDIPDLLKSCKNFHISMGFLPQSNRRKELFLIIKKQGGVFPTITASTARISKNVKLGEGTIVHHYVFVNREVSVADNSIINTAAILEHDVAVGSHCHISTRSILNGGVQIGDEVFVGSNSTIKQGVKVLNEAVIGMGSVVLTDVAEQDWVYGNPAKKK